MINRFHCCHFRHLATIGCLCSSWSIHYNLNRLDFQANAHQMRAQQPQFTHAHACWNCGFDSVHIKMTKTNKCTEKQNKTAQQSMEKTKSSHIRARNCLLSQHNFILCTHFNSSISALSFHRNSSKPWKYNKNALPYQKQHSHDSNVYCVRHIVFCVYAILRVESKREKKEKKWEKEIFVNGRAIKREWEWEWEWECNIT